MNNQEMMELSTVDKSDFEELVKECTASGIIDQNLYTEYDVKRGLRDSNGNGVLRQIHKNLNRSSGTFRSIHQRCYYESYKY